MSASFESATTPLAKLNDGNYWYERRPPNRWTTEKSTNRTDWVAVDFGVQRKVRTVKLYLLDDGEKLAAPQRIDLQYWTGKRWAEVPGQRRIPEQPAGHRANVIAFPELGAAKLRAVFTHRDRARTGLSEFEVWGDATHPVSASK